MKRFISLIYKSLFGICLLIYLPFEAYSQLHGNYTINPTSAATNTNYRNWASAVRDLLSGSRTDGGTPQGSGVSAAVTITAYDTVYPNIHIQITAIPGASYNNTITFKSTNDSSICVLKYASGTTAADDYILMLNGADYITFKQIGFERTGTNAYFTVVQILNNADRNSFIRCWMKTRKMPCNSILTWTTGIGAQIFFSGNGDSTLISQNKMIYGYNGVYCATACTGNIVSNNIFDTIGSVGTFMTLQTDLKITGNTFKMGDFGIGSGHYVSYSVRIENSASVVVTKNKMFMLATNAQVVRGMVFVSVTGTATAPNLINNNWILNSGGTSSCSGISLYGIDHLELYYNNFLITNSMAAGSVIHDNTSYTNTHIEQKNNNLINKGGGLIYDLQNSNNTGFDSFVNNNCYTTGSVFSYWTYSTSYSTFAAWRAATGKDANSVNIDPAYSSNTNLHVSNIGIYGKAIPYWRVKDDIDGETRKTTNPDIGADEFILANDAGIIELTNPGNADCGGLQQVSAVIKNFGGDTLKSATINWSVDNISQTPYNWNGSLITKASDTVIIGTFDFSGNLNPVIRVSSSLPNGYTDEISFNDSFMTTRQLNVVPTANAGPDLNVCLGDSVLVGPTASVGFSYKWMTISNTVIAIYSQMYVKPKFSMTLVFEVTSSSNGCSKTDTVNLRVNSKPLVNAGQDRTICPGTSTQIGVPFQSGFRYNWTSIPQGYNTVIANPTVLPTQTTTYILKKTQDTTGCYDFDSVKITLASKPAPQIHGDTNLCKNNARLYSTTFTSGNTYFWKVTTGQILFGQNTNNISIKWTTAGQGNLKVIETNSSKCKDSALLKISILPNPTAKMSLIGRCSGNQISFIDSSFNIQSRIWYFGDGQTATQTKTSHIYTKSGTYHVKLIVYNSLGCFDSVEQALIVTNRPQAKFIIVDTEVCPGETISFANNSTDAYSYLWDFGNGRTSQQLNPINTYSKAGNYNVKLVVFGIDCNDTMTKQLTINPFPVARFSYIQKPDMTFDFIDTSIISSGSIVNWNWEFGDGDTSTRKSPTHHYLASGNFKVKLCVTSIVGCGNCFGQNINIVGLNETALSRPISLFPNPGEGYFTIKSDNRMDLIVILNVLGKVVEVIKPQANSTDINLTNHPNGVYFIKINSGDQSQVLRVLKQ